MFVDTSGWASIADRWQSFHARASALVRPVLTGGRTLVTTNFVLVELTALLTSPLRIPRPQQIQWLEDVRSDPSIEVVAIDPPRELAAWDLWRSRPDKEWTLADCASFLVMPERGLAEALTADHH